jgi:hypothetical protein
LQQISVRKQGMSSFPPPAAKIYKPTAEDRLALDTSMLRKNGMLQTCRDLRDTFCIIPLIKRGVFDDEERRTQGVAQASGSAAR